MKHITAFAAAAIAFACSASKAALLTVEPPFSANGVYSFYLHGESTTFNGVAFSVKPHCPELPFQNVTSGFVVGLPRPAGQNFTYRNRLLDTPTDDPEIPGGKGWTLLGVVNTPQEIAFSGGPLGQTISTAGEPGGKLFLANFKLPLGGGLVAELQLVNGADTVHAQTFMIPLTPHECVPEPAALALAIMSALSVKFACRRGPA
jgi:hypothetical protein